MIIIKYVAVNMNDKSEFDEFRGMEQTKRLDGELRFFSSWLHSASSADMLCRLTSRVQSSAFKAVRSVSLASNTISNTVAPFRPVLALSATNVADRSVVDDIVMHTPIPFRAVSTDELHNEYLRACEEGVTDAVLELPDVSPIEGLDLQPPTYKPNFLQRKRKHGFLSRLRTKSGRRIQARRAVKGRKYIGL